MDSFSPRRFGSLHPWPWDNPGCFHPRTLVERFGEQFFRELPEHPGVYFFCGVDAGVLCVGQAKHLRRRLSSYRVASPERSSRRLISLLNQVARIEYAVCVNESVARHRVGLFICVLAPKFNRTGKVWPRKLLHDDDILTYNRTVPDFERMRLNPNAASKPKLIGGDSRGSQEKKESRKEEEVV
jgi:hypothetical protein